MEAVKLCLPEDRRIQLGTASDLLAIATRLEKPIIRGSIDKYPASDNPNATGVTAYVVAVYDGGWVYYCELGVGKARGTLPEARESEDQHRTHNYAKHGSHLREERRRQFSTAPR